MPNMPWIDTYQPQNWKLYSIPMPETPGLINVMDEFVVCGTDSVMARQVHEAWQSRGGTPPQFFFFDFEQMAADHSGTAGLSQLGRLAEEWQGHPAGTLVMITYEGIEQGDCTCYVALS